MLHEEIAFCAEGEGGDGGGGTEEALVVAVVGDAVGAGGVVVYEAEVVGGGGEDFGDFAQLVEAVGDWARFAAAVAVGLDGSESLAVEEGAVGAEGGG